MTNILLADEINRASAKTQAALLEVMEENQVTVDSVTREYFVCSVFAAFPDTFGLLPPKKDIQLKPVS